MIEPLSILTIIAFSNAWEVLGFLLLVGFFLVFAWALSKEL